MNKIFTTILSYAPFIISILIGAIVHELSHAYTAYLLGDNTAKDAGRLTLNPLKHIDLFSTIILPIVLSIAGFLPLILFKPVPINERNFRNGRIDSIKVALAGPVSNFLLMVLMIILINIVKLINIKSPYFNYFFSQYIAIPFLFANLVLFAFNLLPIPPLDGSWVIKGFLPVRWRFYYQRIYGIITVVFILLVISGKFHFIFRYIINFLLKIVLFFI